jgi:prevent-host-death family protein
MTPRAVGARELKTRLGRYLREVREGSVIVIIDRGEPVAGIRPIARAKGGDLARLDRLVALGVLARPSPRPLPRFRPIRHQSPPLTVAVVEGREDRF